MYNILSIYSKNHTLKSLFRNCLSIVFRDSQRKETIQWAQLNDKKYIDFKIEN